MKGKISNIMSWAPNFTEILIQINQAPSFRRKRKSAQSWVEPGLDTEWHSWAVCLRHWFVLMRLLLASILFIWIKISVKLGAHDMILLIFTFHDLLMCHLGAWTTFNAEIRFPDKNLENFEFRKSSQYLKY